MRAFRLLLGLMALAPLAGCGNAPTAPAPGTAVDVVGSVTNMVPVPGTALQAGQVVTFSGTPAYILTTADVGSLFMVVADQNDRPLDSSGSQVTVVHRGSGDATIARTVTVPAAGVTAVQVSFTLAPAGAAPTTSARLTYPVR